MTRSAATSSAFSSLGDRWYRSPAYRKKSRPAMTAPAAQKDSPPTRTCEAMSYWRNLPWKRGTLRPTNLVAKPAMTPTVRPALAPSRVDALIDCKRGFGDVDSIFDNNRDIFQMTLAERRKGYVSYTNQGYFSFNLYFFAKPLVKISSSAWAAHRLHFTSWFQLQSSGVSAPTGWKTAVESSHIWSDSRSFLGKQCEDSKIG